MNLNLKKLADEGSRAVLALNLTERLPDNVQSPCVCECACTAVKHANYYLLTIEVRGVLHICCQRCLNEFAWPLDRTLQLAVCTDEAMAEKLMDQYESIVAERFNVDLNELLTDEIILAAPAIHETLTACDPDIQNFFSEK